MKKLFFPVLAFAALFTATQAQAQSDAQTPAIGKEKYLNVGIGLGAYTAGGIPVGASFEVGIKDKISVGGFADYARYGRNYGGYKWHYNFLYFGARASYQLHEVAEILNLRNSRIAPYAGLSAGFRTVSYSDNLGTDVSYDTYGNGMFIGIHAGTRYYFTEKVGGFAEIGYGVSALKFGVTAKF